MFLLILVLISYARTYFRKGVRSLPGPALARFSGLYRLSLVHDGHAPERYRELHQKYGPIVRTGPNHVSVSDTAMIPAIYGIGSKFLKVITEIFLGMNSADNIADSFLHDNGPFLPRCEDG